jgi:hypothetical protein
MDAIDELRFFRFSRNNCPGIESIVSKIEPKISFPMRRVGSMTIIAIFREDGLDVPVKGNRSPVGKDRECREEEQCVA